MTNKTHSSISIFCFVLILLFRTDLLAQPIVPPNLSDNTIITGCGEGFGTAMISYDTTVFSPAKDVIFGAAWESSCSTSLITVTDVGTGNVATCMPSGLPPGTGWSYSSIPDVVIGNASTPGNFVMAVAYSKMYMASNTLIMVDFYNITGAGTSSLHVSFNSSVMVAALPLSLQGEDVHIDIIAEHPASLSTLPLCRRFGLTFEDQVGGNVFITSGDVSTYTVNPPCPIAGGTQMDIAAIQRNVALVGPPIIHDYALLTWIRNTGDVMYGEYDLTTSTCGMVPGTVHIVETLAGSPYLAFTSPRIDGDDDYTTNAPGGTSAVYELAYAANTSFCAAGPDYDAANIHTFNNILASPYDPTTGLAGSPLLGIGSFNPVPVRAGSGNYDVFHWVGDYFLGPYCYNQQAGAMVMEPIKNSSGTMAGYPYYEVSTGVSPGAITPNINDNLIYTWHGGEWSISASSTCNAAFLNSSLILYAWVQLGVVGAYAPQAAMYKLSPSVPYGFREANQITGTIGVSQNISLSPNPNTGIFSIIGTVPTDKTTDEATIEIIDLLGNTVFTDKAVVTNGALNMQVNLGSNLGNGTYIARLKCASSNQVTRFTLDR